MNAPFNPQAYLLPYQRRWLDDRSRLKIWSKSRRIGATYVQALEDVIDAARAQGGMNVWFSSADESAAQEYILYCQEWARLANIVAEDIDGDIIVDERQIKTFSIRFENGNRITGLSSNPKAFRSKGGKLVLDEFALHKQADELWKAAAPIITWGYPVRIISTHNGRGCRYFHMVTEAAKTESEWSLHRVPIHKAVDQGLADKIKGKELDAQAREAFIAECRDIAGDEDTFQQEFCCVAVDETTAWLTYDLIRSCIDEHAGKPHLVGDGACYVGMDIGRKADLTVIWVVEQVGDVLWTREVVRLKKARFAEQLSELDRVIALYRPVRVCMDETGMGLPVVEEAQKRHGVYVAEGVTFSAKTKQDLAVVIKQRFEDRQVRIPDDRAIIEAHHAIKKMVTSAGNARFDAERTSLGHADEFWAHALALHGISRQPPAFGVTIDGEEEWGYGII